VNSTTPWDERRYIRFNTGHKPETQNSFIITERRSNVKIRITIYVRKENYKLPYFTVPDTAEQEDEVN